MYKADGKRLDQMTPEELAALPNFYDDEKPPKHLKHMLPQDELTELVNGNNITLEKLMTEVSPFGFFWVMVNGVMMDYSLSWEPGFTNFTDSCHRKYGKLLRSIVEIHPQGLLCIDYDNPKKAEEFVTLMKGVLPRSTTAAMLGV